MMGRQKLEVRSQKEKQILRFAQDDSVWEANCDVGEAAS